MRYRRRGFNLLEIMVVIALLVLLIAMGFVSTRRTADRSRSRGLAQRLVAELTSARLMAIAKQTPIAVVFPSDGGSGVCQSMYWVEGIINPRVTKEISFSTEFPGLYIFVGSWQLSSGSFTADRPNTGRDPYGFDIEKWLTSRPNLADDYVYIFTPQGVTLSNNMPIAENAYRIAVGARPLVAAKPLPGGLTLTGSPPRFELSAMADPQTVTLELTGECRQTDGIALGNVPETGGEASVYAAGTLPARDHPPKIPQITRIEVLPKEDGEGTGTSGTCGPDALVTLRVYATDEDGDALICNWRTTNGGNFTNVGPTRMVYHQEEGAWISTWCFSGDGDAPTGTVYDLQCEVRDTDNNVATRGASVSDTRNLTFNRHPKIVFVDGGCDTLYMAGPDGTDFQFIPLVGLSPGAPCQSPDGTSVVFGDANLNNIWTVNLDGSAPRKLHNQGTCPVYSPDGTKIAYVSGGALKVMLACGSERPVPGFYDTTLIAAGVANRPPSWAPNGDAIACTVSGGVQVVNVTFPVAGPPVAGTPVAVGPAYGGGTSGTAFGAFRPKVDPANPTVYTLMTCTPFGTSYGDLHIYYYDAATQAVTAGPQNIDQIGGSTEPGVNQTWMNPESSICFSRDGGQVSFGYCDIVTADFTGTSVTNAKNVCDVSSIFASWGTTTNAP